MNSAKDDPLTEGSPLTGRELGKESAKGSADQSAEPRFLAIGRVTRPHGVNGEVRVELMTDVPERFKWLNSVYLGEKLPRQVALDSVRFHQDVVLIKLAGYPTRDDAERLLGELIQIPESEAIPLEEDEYFLYQLIGLEVFTVYGVHLGRLDEVLETGANNVFVVNSSSGQHLLPDIPDVIKEIDIDNGRLVIFPMPGLIDGQGE